MKKAIFNPGKHTNPASIALLIYRLAFSVMMITHGLPKLVNFGTKSETFADPFGIGSTFSLALVVFAELFAPMLVIIGLATRLAVIPVIVTMAVAAFSIHAGDPFADKEMSLLYLTAFTGILIAGAGKFSVDAMIK